MSVFERPVGSPADVKELEYVSALHQTSTEVRTDGSLKAEDVQALLQSRHGIHASLETVQDTILQGMGGSSDEIDLVETTAILLIPYLVEVARESSATDRKVDLKESVRIHQGVVINQVLQMILHDVFLVEEREANDDATVIPSANNRRRPPPALKKDLIQKILRAYGEDDLADDDVLVHDMLQMVSGHSVLNAQAFTQALTRDVQKYSSTPIVFPAKFDDISTSKTSNDRSSDDGVRQYELPNDMMPSVTRSYTAAQMDMSANTFRSKSK